MQQEYTSDIESLYQWGTKDLVDETQKIELEQYYREWLELSEEYVKDGEFYVYSPKDPGAGDTDLP